MSVQVDVAVIGAGAAGLAAAMAARRRGASTAIIERGRLGGDCTWTGCVPSKTLIEHAGRVHAARRLGVDVDVDLAAVMRHVRDVITSVAEDESRSTLEASGIAVLEGQASFVTPRQLSVDGTRVDADVVVIATGSAPLMPPVDGLAEAAPLTNETVFDLVALPSRMAVLGGGPIGLELGQAFGRLGSQVTIIEALPRLASKEEPEASELLRHVLTSEGVALALGAPAVRVERDVAGTTTVTTDDGAQVVCDALLCAVGRTAITDGLELDRVGVALDSRGHVEVDGRLRTTARGVYAVGDVTGKLQFTHAGYEMGALAVDNALGRIPRSFDTRAVPWATFTDPEVGRVGMTEDEAFAAHGDAARVAYFPIAETDRAKVTGDTEGFVKLVAAPHPVVRALGGGQLVGGTVMCRTGGDVVHELALAMRTRMILGRLAQTVHAYPSWSLAVREAAAMFFGAHKGREARPARPATGGAA